MLGRAVCPCHCALAIGIPITEGEFSEDLAAGPSKDLARIAKSWSVYEKQVAAPLTVAVMEAERAGVTVRRRAGLQDLQELCERFKTITVIGHWKYLLIDAADVVNVGRFHQLLREGLEREAVSGEGRKDLHATFGDDPLIASARTPTELAAAVSAHLYAGWEYHSFVEQVDRAPPAKSRPKAGPTRALVEREYPGCFLPGRSLELGNRLCTIDDFVTAVPEKYDGLLDLTNCFSLILAEAVRDQRALCNAICIRGPATPGIRFTMYRYIIAELKRSAQPYEAAAKTVHLAMMDEIRRRGEESAG